MKAKSARLLLLPGAFFLVLNLQAAAVPTAFLRSLVYYLFLAALFLCLRRFNLRKWTPPAVGILSLVLFSHGLFQKWITLPRLQQGDFTETFTPGFAAHLSHLAGRDRIYSIFGLPTLYALVCAVLLIAIFHLLVSSSSWTSRLPWIILGIAGLLNLYYTRSFGGILYLGTGILVTLLLSRRVPPRTLLIVVLMATLLFGGIMIHRFSEARQLQPVRLRLHSWRQAGEMLLDHPWAGAGLGHFRILFPQYVRSGEATSLYTHNFFLQTLAETGIPAFLFLLLSAILGIQYLSRTHTSRLPGRAWHWGILAALALYSLIDIGPLLLPSGIILVFILSLMLPSSSRAGSPFTSAVLGGIVLLLSILQISVTVSSQIRKSGMLAANRGKWSRALDHYRRSLRLDPWNYRSLLGMAHCQMSMGEHEKARNSLNRLLRINPCLSEAHYLRSRLYLRDHEPEKAFRSAQRALDHYPASDRYQQWYHRLRRALLHSGDKG